MSAVNKPQYRLRTWVDVGCEFWRQTGWIRIKKYLLP